jgi:hypothetical protein
MRTIAPGSDNRSLSVLRNGQSRPREESALQSPGGARRIDITHCRSPRKIFGRIPSRRHGRLHLQTNQI